MTGILTGIGSFLVGASLMAVTPEVWPFWRRILVVFVFGGGLDLWMMGLAGAVK